MRLDLNGTMVLDYTQQMRRTSVKQTQNWILGHVNWIHIQRLNLNTCKWVRTWNGNERVETVANAAASEVKR
jgi:hypothetical protein